jgi:hypothetical protein
VNAPSLGVMAITLTSSTRESPQHPSLAGRFGYESAWIEELTVIFIEPHDIRYDESSPSSANQSVNLVSRFNRPSGVAARTFEKSWIIHFFDPRGG